MKGKVSRGNLVVYLFPEGHWAWEWDRVALSALSRLYGEGRRVDLDQNTKYSLSHEEIISCIEAIDEAEASRSGRFRKGS